MNCGITINITTMMMDGQIQQIQFTEGKKLDFPAHLTFLQKMMAIKTVVQNSIYILYQMKCINELIIITFERLDIYLA